MKYLLFCFVFIVSIAGTAMSTQTTTPHPKKPECDKQNKIAILWTSGDIEVANKVCLMYAHGAKSAKWFDEVVLIVWGPSSKLLASNIELQNKIKKMKRDGIKVKACIVCANMYGITQKLKDIGIEVKPMGAPLSDYIKTGYHTLTF